MFSKFRMGFLVNKWLFALAKITKLCYLDDLEVDVKPIIYHFQFVSTHRRIYLELIRWLQDEQQIDSSLWQKLEMLEIIKQYTPDLYAYVDNRVEKKRDY